MPTDGADFGRAKACYGKAFTAARIGIADGEVAATVCLGLEREVRMCGGMPAFNPAVELVVQISKWPGGNPAHQFVDAVDALSRRFADSSLMRDVADAALKVGLAIIHEGRAVFSDQVAKALLVEMGKGRCDQLSGYITRNRTQCIETSAAIVASIKAELPVAASLHDLAERMCKGSAKGLPAKAPKAPPIEHSAESLNSIDIEGGV